MALHAVPDIVAEVVWRIEIVVNGDVRQAAGVTGHARVVPDVVQREAGILLNARQAFVERVGDTVAGEYLNDTGRQYKPEQQRHHQLHQGHALLVALHCRVCFISAHSAVVNSNSMGACWPWLSSQRTV